MGPYFFSGLWVSVAPSEDKLTLSTTIWADGRLCHIKYLLFILAERLDFEAASSFAVKTATSFSQMG